MPNDRSLDLDFKNRDTSRGSVGFDTKNLPKIHNLFDNPIDFFEMLDTLPTGVAVLDLNRKIITMNRALEALTGFEKAKSLRRDLRACHAPQY